MKTQHIHLIHQEAIVGFALLLLAAVGGGAWWVWQTTTPKSLKQTPIPSRVEKPPVATVPPTVIPYQTQQPAIVTVPPTAIPYQTRKPSVMTVPPTVIPHQTQKPPVATVPPTVIPTPLTTSTPKINQQVTQLQAQTYWLQATDEQIRLVPQEVALKPEDSSEVALKTAFDNLFTSSKTSNLTTTIPAGTRLLDLQVTKTGIYVNLSKEFTQGGGSTSMIGRVAQVLYTATSIEPEAKVYLLVEGRLLDEENPLGGEGIILTEPLTRQQFAQDFAIQA
ncbi:GerMN domain-containing protein [Chlorogloeopsis sp. ULAP01]|uniref:GerMN domain-containing protein n=1 Tax=Chlorogloeopsis sp. ULAP01 TaxID=3056483 RepID=UPI0025AAF236|nr:GerMN domain-containing protein [Chlorogloeopsis sp. ULAP01]MDM9383816.1 GerMN domain-containing protein [Chlorogloeopsis sp. ULAP01]